MCYYIKWVDTILNHVSASSIKVELDLSNYAKKLISKKARSVNTSNLPAKSDLASLKAEVDKIDIDNLKTIHPDLSKLRNVVYNNVVKKNHVWKIYCEG